MRRLPPLEAVIAVVLAGCGSSPSAPTTTSASPYRATYAAVCVAARDARGGDNATARTVFLDRAHQGVHLLATAAAEHDRSAAGRLLERKERVEHDLDTPTTTGQLADDLDALSATVSDAIAATGAARPPTCKESTR